MVGTVVCKTSNGFTVANPRRWNEVIAGEHGRQRFMCLFGWGCGRDFVPFLPEMLLFSDDIGVNRSVQMVITGRYQR